MRPLRCRGNYCFPLDRGRMALCWEVRGAPSSLGPSRLRGVVLRLGVHPPPHDSRAGEERTMAYLTRRSVLRGSVALGAPRVFGAPHIAKAAATTATVWFAQGFVQDEDVALRKAVADYEKASGNKIELSIIPFAPERQKIISAITSGVVPDMIDSNPAEILQIYGWQDRWVDVSDVVETQKAQFSETALQA